MWFDIFLTRPERKVERSFPVDKRKLLDYDIGLEL